MKMLGWDLHRSSPNWSWNLSHQIQHIIGCHTKKNNKWVMSQLGSSSDLMDKWCNNECLKQATNYMAIIRIDFESSLLSFEVSIPRKYRFYYQSYEIDCLWDEQGIPLFSWIPMGFSWQWPYSQLMAVFMWFLGPFLPGVSRSVALGALHVENDPTRLGVGTWKSWEKSPKYIGWWWFSLSKKESCTPWGVILFEKVC